MRARAFLILGLLVLSGCQARAVRPEPPRGDQASLYVYIRPLPDTADRLRLAVTEVAAVGAGGEDVPLRLRGGAEIGGREKGRQRLLAVGQLPPGSYRGMSITIGKAWLRGEEGETALLIPEEPVFVDVAFSVGKAKAVLLDTAYRQKGAVRQGFRLEPEFTAHVPPKPIVNRTGYAVSSTEDHIAVFDRKTLEVLSVIATGNAPASVVMDERERRAYVALSEEDAVQVVDVAAGLVVARAQLRAGDRPTWLALAPNGIVLCANRGSNTMSFIDGRSGVEMSRVAVGIEPEYVLVDRRGRRAYVFNTRSVFLTVVDIARQAVMGSVATEVGPFRGAFNRTSDRLYVIHRDSPYLIVIDANRLDRLDRLLVGIGASSLIVDQDTDLIYLGKRNSPVMDVYDPFSLLPVDFVEVPGWPADMVIDREENRLLLAMPEVDAVVAVDLFTKKLRGKMDVGRDPRSIDVMGSRH